MELFKDYIEKYFILKTEKSDWPRWAKTEEQKNEYLNNFYEQHGFRLNRYNIEDNLGLKNISKMFLNSLWGKFGQRENMGKTENINDPVRLN